MSFWKLTAKTLMTGIPLLLGVTFVSFVLMVFYGPDLSYTLAGKNPSPQLLQEIRHNLGYDQGFWQRYGLYLKELITLDFGHSLSKDQQVITMLNSAFPTTLLLLLPGFIIGNCLSLAVAMVAAKHQGRLIDKAIMTGSVLGMSISFLVVIIAFQLLFSSSQGLNWFPVRGWVLYDTSGQWSLSQYLQHVAVPSFAMIFVTLGYNTRFYRAILVEELSKDHILTARANGISPFTILTQSLLKNAMVPILTRFLFSIPLVLVTGALLIESHFGIPGMGQLTYDAIMAGDQPVLKAVVALTAVVFVVLTILSDAMNQWIDPRLRPS